MGVVINDHDQVIIESSERLSRVIASSQINLISALNFQLLLDVR